MSVDELHLDGNAIAGLLGEIAGAEMTAVVRTCQSCGARRPLADHRAHRSAGVVLRCPACRDIALVIGVQDQRLVVSWRGTFEFARTSA